MTTPQDLPRRLHRGQSVALDSLDAGLGGLTVYLDSYGGKGAPFDVDLSVLLLDRGLRIQAESDFVFYNQPRARDGAVHLRDKLAASQSSEGHAARVSNVLTLELDDLPDAVERIAFIASVDDAQTEALDVGESLQLRIQRTSDAVDLVAFDISPGPERALVIGDLRRRDGRWAAHAVGDGYEGGLAAVVEAHGVEVEAEESQQDTTATAEQALVEPAAPLSRISMKRAVAAPKLARDWNGPSRPAAGTTGSPRDSSLSPESGAARSRNVEQPRPCSR